MCAPSNRAVHEVLGRFLAAGELQEAERDPKTSAARRDRECSASQEEGSQTEGEREYSSTSCSNCRIGAPNMEFALDVRSPSLTAACGGSIEGNCLFTGVQACVGDEVSEDAGNGEGNAEGRAGYEANGHGGASWMPSNVWNYKDGRGAIQDDVVLIGDVDKVDDDSRCGDVFVYRCGICTGREVQMW